MKSYEKPEIDITEFHVSDCIAADDSEMWGGDDLILDGDNVFLGEEEGYFIG